MKRKLKKKVVVIIGLLVVLVPLSLILILKLQFPKEFRVVEPKTTQVAKTKQIRKKVDDKYIVQNYPITKSDFVNQYIEDAQKAVLDTQAFEKSLVLDYNIEISHDRYYTVTLITKTDSVYRSEDIKSFDASLTQEITAKDLFTDRAYQYLKVKPDQSFKLKTNSVEVNGKLIDKDELGDYIREPYGDVVLSHKQLPSVYTRREVAKEDKLIAITFDDGPSSAITQDILKTAKEYDAQLTFFVLASNAERFPEITRSILDQGHQLASHSYTHPNLRGVSAEELQHQVIGAEKAINAIIGTSDELMIRPPYGAVNESVLNNAPRMYINWTVDTEDWRSRNAQSVCDSIVNDAYDGAIILMHDLYESTAEGFACGIKELAKQGYTFVSVDSLFAARGVAFENSKLYFDAEQ